MTPNDRTLHALDASRRAGWAKFFAADERAEELTRIIDELLDLIVFHDRLPTHDPPVQRAIEIRRRLAS
ncbi:MAG: hypothetical protein ACO3LZ_08545 [Candidatus Nanopelagicales bacterium]